MLIYHFEPLERTASSVDEFVAVCEAERVVAAAHLRHGYFEPWLRDTGRPDLAAAAAAVRDTDGPAEAALAQFLRVAVGSAGSAPRKSKAARVSTRGRARTAR
jgi:hypothetical protein